MTASKASQLSDADQAERLSAIDWNSCRLDLNRQGYTIIPKLLQQIECRQLIDLWTQTNMFRKKIVMESHGYGRGEYQYFAYPLPKLITTLRTSIYPKLAEIANDWNSAMKVDVQFPATHEQFLQRCHDAGQVRPTPLVLKYGPGDFNCLHQDLYGEHVFPLQLATLLSEPGPDFSGGEFVLTEQRPRMQSKVMVVPLKQGDAVVFAVNNRPVKGTRGNYRVNMRHGVSEILSGNRYTAGIIFHDAK